MKNSSIIFILLVIALMVLGASLYAILNIDIYESRALQVSFHSNDFSNLIVLVPYLLVGTWLVFRKSDVWLWVVPGGLFFSAYVYVPYVITLKVNALFMIYISIVTMSIYTLVVIMATRDYKSLNLINYDKGPVKTTIVIMLILGTGILLRQSYYAVSAVISDKTVEMIDMAMWVDDLILGCPVMLLSAYYLYKQQGIGYVAGPAMMLCYALLSLGLLPYFYFDSKGTGHVIQWDGIITVFVMVLLCFIPFIGFLRGHKGRRGAH